MVTTTIVWTWDRTNVKGSKLIFNLHEQILKTQARVFCFIMEKSPCILELVQFASKASLTNVLIFCPPVHTTLNGFCKVIVTQEMEDLGNSNVLQ